MFTVKAHIRHGNYEASETTQEWRVSKHGTPDSHPQYGIHNGGNDFCIVTGADAKAKAQLIASAPELLEALEKVLDFQQQSLEADAEST